MPTPTRIGRCPRCGKSVPLTSDNAWRPFCSERCKTIDLGDWANERHRIAGDNPPAQDSGPTED